MTRSMPKWRGFTDWTPPSRVVELVAAIATGSWTPGRAASCGSVPTTWTRCAA